MMIMPFAYTQRPPKRYARCVLDERGWARVYFWGSLRSDNQSHLRIHSHRQTVRKVCILGRGARVYFWGLLCSDDHTICAYTAFLTATAKRYARCVSSVYTFGGCLGAAVYTNDHAIHVYIRDVSGYMPLSSVCDVSPNAVHGMACTCLWISISYLGPQARIHGISSIPNEIYRSEHTSTE